MPNEGFIALIILALVHLLSNQARIAGWVWHGNFLSFAAGLSFAYVFVDLLPSLEKGQPVIKKMFDDIIPYFDRHAYLIALLGVLFYYGLHKSGDDSKTNYWMDMFGYLLFNFFVGAGLADSSNPDIQPITLFTVAIAMHYFVHDHNVGEDDEGLYQTTARWLLIFALFAGYFVGYVTHIPDAVAAIAISFIAGGVILNTLRYELPKRQKIGFSYFVLGALFYTALIIGVGNLATSPA